MKLLRSLFIPHHTNTYKPHLIRRHGLALVLVLVLGIQLLAGIQANTGQVLGYASNVSHSELLALTNSNRAASGLPALSLNGSLSSAAQSKANHMIANDYWSHNAPDGTTPWYFIDSSGYSYVVAGENLAYGFDSSGGVVSGWMASPGHKANILHTAYEEVGFGIADGANYQGGPNTVVVAHYGDPVAVAAAPSPSPKPAVAQTVDSSPKTPPAAAAPVEKKTPTEQSASIEDEKETNAPALNYITNVESTPKRISNMEAMLQGQAHWSLYATITVLLAVSFVYLYRHVLFIHNAIIKGEKYVAAHPLLEASLIYLALWLLLNGTHGVIF